MFKVPKKTSVYKTDPNPEKHTGTMFFATELIKFIKANKKYRTYRYGNKYAHLKPGDQITIKENGNENLSLNAIIKTSNQTTFKDLPPRSEIAHESYQDKEHQRKVFSGYYAFLGRPIADSNPFLIIEFELI